MSRRYTSEESLEIDGEWYAGVDYEPPRIQLNQALAIFEDEIPDIKESCQKNIIHVVRDNPAPEPTGNETLDEVRGDLHKMLIKKEISGYQKTLKRISSLETHKRSISKDRITDEDIERAREHPIDELYLGDLKGPESGRRFGRCPFHDERTPSFCIHPDNRWSCFGQCSAHGDSIDYYMRDHGVDFISAVNALK